MIRWFLASFVLAAAVVAADPSLLEIYHEARLALQRGDAARCAELLEPALKNANATNDQLAPAQLALGIAWIRLGKFEPAIEFLKKAAAHFAGKPEAPNVFAPLGDAYRAAGRNEDARRAYAQAENGDRALVNVRYAKARLTELSGVHYLEAVQLPEAATEFLDAAALLLSLGTEDPAYLLEARTLYEKVAKGTGKPGKDWRGEATARAVFGLGEVERARGKLPEAIAYYQRTFVSWLRYPQWAAKAYLRAAECMDKLGKREFAIRHLRELVRKVDRYGKLPEYEQAKKQLRAWGEDVR